MTLPAGALRAVLGPTPRWTAAPDPDGPSPDVTWRTAPGRPDHFQYRLCGPDGDPLEVDVPVPHPTTPTSAWANAADDVHRRTDEKVDALLAGRRSLAWFPEGLPDGHAAAVVLAGGSAFVDDAPGRAGMDGAWSPHARRQARELAYDLAVFLDGISDVAAERDESFPRFRLRVAAEVARGVRAGGTAPGPPGDLPAPSLTALCGWPVVTVWAHAVHLEDAELGVLAGAHLLPPT